MIYCLDKINFSLKIISIDKNFETMDKIKDYVIANYPGFTSFQVIAVKSGEYKSIEIK